MTVLAVLIVMSNDLAVCSILSDTSWLKSLEAVAFASWVVANWLILFSIYLNIYQYNQMGNVSKHAVLALLPTSESPREILREKYKGSGTNSTLDISKNKKCRN